MKEYVKRGEGDEGIRHEEEREMKEYVTRRRGR